jgi:RHS repeat-associated protein
MLDRSYNYDNFGRLIVSPTDYEARLHMGRDQTIDPAKYGAYSQAYGYDQWGNMTSRVGWGGWDGSYVNWTMSYTNNQLTTNPATLTAMSYDGGNLTNDGNQTTYSYDATGQQTSISGGILSSYDGDRLRVKKAQGLSTTYYLRSSVLGGQVVYEMNGSGTWTRGYVYQGGQMLAIQASSAVSWVHQDSVTKSQRVTDSAGAVVSTIDLDPWGGETSTSSSQAFQPHRFTTYERDLDGGDDAMMRRYAGTWMRFAQPDPYDGSYEFGDPQSFNRYAYTQNDPVNLVDPSGLEPPICMIDGMETNCSTASGMVQSGAGVVAPLETTRYDYGSGTFVTFSAVQTSSGTATGWIPQGAHYIGGLSWGWTDESREGWPSYTYSFTVDRLSTLTVWNGRMGWDGGSLFRGVDGYPDQKGGVETDWNAQMAIGGALNGLRGALGSAVRSSAVEGAESAADNFATRQLGTLIKATATKGNYGLGSATYDEAMIIGESWVGPGARLMSSGRGWVSADGLRAFRFPSLKAGSGVTQANVLRLTTNAWNAGKYIVVGNGHITIH